MSKGAILVVDDESEIREGLELLLNTEGYSTSSAESGEAGLTMLEEKPFDLVLLDMIMPGLDGFQVLAKFKADSALREIPIIMLSALDEAEKL